MAGTIWTRKPLTSAARARMERRREVMRRWRQGWTNKQIADRLGVSLSTVKNDIRWARAREMDVEEEARRARLIAKAKAEARAEIYLEGFQHGRCHAKDGEEGPPPSSVFAGRVWFGRRGL